MIDGETTVKTFQRVDGKVWLIPHNPAYEPIPWPVPSEDATSRTPPSSARSWLSCVAFDGESERASQSYG